ncbi:MAG: HEAT repeat domain-containing protein, partial [Verrucomicrobiales bacterium]|nr:HEAT repeat domain-containing protein [Verrucomicrobiales bacterium]
SSAEKAKQALDVIQSDAPPQDKAVACKRLAVYGGTEAVPYLARLLGDAQLASWARIPLEVIPGAAADDALRDALGRLNGNLLVGVINSIGVRGDARAVDPLAARLKDSDTEVASAAAVALGKIGGSGASRALESALDSAPAGTRSAVAEGLILVAERAAATGPATEAVRLYDQVRRANLPQQRILEATRGAILARHGEGLPLLLQTLRSSDSDTFAIGLRTARELPGRPTTDALAAEIPRTAPERQGHLLLALADRGDAAAWPVVREAAAKGAPSVRVVAIGILERQASMDSLPTLLLAATDADSQVAKAAKAAIGRLPAKELDADLTGRLNQASGPTRRVLVELAGQRRIAAALPKLLAAAADSDPELRSAGIKALGETVAVGDLGQLADLLPKAKSEDDLADIEAALDSACARLTDKTGCADVLLARLPATNPAARSAALRVLGTAGTPNALAAVRSSMTHDDASVRDAAFRVLAEWPEPAALPALLDVVRSSADDTRRTLALRGTVRLLGQSTQPAADSAKTYAELLALAKRVDDRKLVLSGLGKVADRSALALVEPLLADASVRKEAEAAMLGIAGGLAKSAPAEAKAAAKRIQAESQDAPTRDKAAQLLKRLE